MTAEISITDQFLNVWKRLKKHWGPYFERAGLDVRGLTRDNVRKRLTTPMRSGQVKFRVSGLEDLARECRRGIEPGDPALSLFYHVLASPNVNPPEIESEPENYPTIADLEIVENFVYATANMTLERLRAKANGQELAIVVFAYEYAPEEDTVHGRHADLCFSRTGICRVGNREPAYEYHARGFFPYSNGTKCVHVVPARYGVFVACQRRGSKTTIGPLRLTPDDTKRSFWVPLHKIFPGKECIQGVDIDLSFESKHVNEKIRKVHAALQSTGMATGWDAWQMEKKPFVITEGLAAFCSKHGLMIPDAHDPLVEPAKTSGGRLVGFPVPHKHQLGASALWLKSDLKGRPWPEFVHIRHQIVENEKGKQELVYLPDTYPGNVLNILQQGGFQAANFIDWTADGYIKAHCPALARALDTGNNRTQSLAAYSVLAQPDFFPLVKQQDLASWWRNSPLKKGIWPDEGVVPTPLSDQRLPANITLQGAGFDSTDTTMTAIIGLYRERLGKQCPPNHERPKRESTLSYRASNLFEPGWDTSEDFGRDARSPQGTFYLTNYGLGSPFPEDTLICSALGAYWPAAVPDTTRFFTPDVYPSTTPLTDSEANWPGVTLPIRDGDTIKYQALNYADYVRANYLGNFHYERFAMVGLEEYILRTEITARFFRYLNSIGLLADPTKSKERARYVITSFERANASDLATLTETGWTAPANKTFRIEWGKAPAGRSPIGTLQAGPPDPRIASVQVGRPRVVFMGPSQAAEENPLGSGNWNVRRRR